jgi:lipopolysaccharide export LptBFGC system permease protein LptF
MMRRLSLSQRLTLVFTVLLLLCAAAACSVQLYSSTRTAMRWCSGFLRAGAADCRP